jgi:hypothetical protein
LQPDSNDFQDVNALRAASRKAGHTEGAPDKEPGLNEFFRTKLYPAFFKLLGDEHTAPPALQPLAPAGAWAATEFDVALLRSNRKARHTQWNEKKAKEFRICGKLETAHIPRFLKESTARKHCAFCGSQVRTLCLTCEEPLCMEHSASEDPKEVLTCWDRWHKGEQIERH